MSNTVDIVIPVYNEGKNIISTFDSLYKNISHKFNIIICFDFEDDDTLITIENSKYKNFKNIFFKKNKSIGPHSAVMTGILTSNADYVIVIPADDDYNSAIVEKMIDISIKEKYDVFCPSRFTNGGTMEGTFFLKKVLVVTANFLLKHLAKMPVHDCTNGFRLFSRNVIDNIIIESSFGFTYSIEYLVKAHRFGFKIGEIPALWKERKYGKSRFQILKWIFPYLRWFIYAFLSRINIK